MIALLLALCVGPPRVDDLPPHVVARLGLGPRWDGNSRPHLAPDGSRVAVRELDGLAIYDTHTGRRTLVDDPGPGTSRPIAFLDDGRLLIGMDDVWILDRSGKPTGAKITLPESWRRIVVSGDGRRIAIGLRPSGKVRLYSFPTMIPLREVTTDFDVAFALSPDGKTLAAWARGAERPHRAVRPPVAEAREGARVLPAVTADDSPPTDRSVALHDCETGKVRRLSAEQVDAPPLIVFSPDGQLFAVWWPWRRAGSVEVREVASGKVRFAFTTPNGAAALRFSPDGRRLVLITPMAAVEVRDLAGRVVSSVPPRRERIVGDVAFRNGTMVALLGNDNVRHGPWEWRLLTDDAVPQDHLGAIQSLAFSEDGLTLYSGATDGVLAWEWRAGKATKHIAASWTAHREGTGTVQLAPGGRFAAFLGADSVEVRELAYGKVVVRPDPRRLSHPAIGFTADGSQMVTLHQPVPDTAGRVLVVRELPGGRVRKEVRLKDPVVPPVSIALSPDGSAGAVVELPRLDATGPKFLPWREVEPTVVLVSFRDGKETGRYRQRRDTRNTFARIEGTVAFSPDGRYLLEAILDGNLLAGMLEAGAIRAGFNLRDPGTGSVVERVDTSPWPALPDWPFAVSRDGRLIACESGEQVVVREWASGQVRLLLPWKREEVSALAFSPDGRYLAAGGPAGTVTVYDLSGAAGLRDLPQVGEGTWAEMAGPSWVPTLLARPKEAVALLRSHLTPAPGKPLSAAAVRWYLADLGAGDFLTRERAHKALVEARGGGELIDAALRDEKDIEARRRLERLVAARRARPDAQQLRLIRAVEVLERIRTPEARRLLAELEAGNDDARLTVEAKAALRRMWP